MLWLHIELNTLIIENIPSSQSAYRTFTKCDHKVSLNSSLNEFQKVEIIQTSFPDHSEMK